MEGTSKVENADEQYHKDAPLFQNGSLNSSISSNMSANRGNDGVSNRGSPMKSAPNRSETSTESTPRENFCVPCDLQLNNSIAYKQHLLGLRHAKRVEEMGLTVQDPIDTALGELQSARLVAFLIRESEPIIGLDSLTERVCTTRSSEDPTYYCDLCDSEFDMGSALQHLTSTQHRFLFLKATRASLISELIDDNGDLVSNQPTHLLNKKLADASAKLESEIGRGVPKITRVSSNTMVNRNFSRSGNPRVAAVAPNSRPYNRYPDDHSDFRNRRGNFDTDRFGPRPRGPSSFDGSFVNPRFNEPMGGNIMASRMMVDGSGVPPMPGRGRAGYMDVDRPQGDRDYSMPTAAHRLLPGEQPSAPRPLVRNQSPQMTATGAVGPKRRRVGGPPGGRVGGNRMDDLEEGEHTDDYDSMLDQYRQEKEEEWVRRNQHGVPEVPERESSPPPSKEIFFQKYVREMHKEWEKWYDEKKQKEEAEKKDKDVPPPASSTPAASSAPPSKKASNLKECKSILAQCRIKDDGDAEVAIEISRALAEAHVQYKLRYMKAEEKTKEIQDTYKTVLGYLREMQSGKVPSLVGTQTSGQGNSGVPAQQMFQMMPPPNMIPPGPMPFQMPNAQFAPNMYPPGFQQTPTSSSSSRPPWMPPLDPRSGVSSGQGGAQQEWTTPANAHQMDSGEQATNPLMMRGGDQKAGNPPMYSQPTSFYQGPSPVGASVPSTRLNAHSSS